MLKTKQFYSNLVIRHSLKTTSLIYQQVYQLINKIIKNSQSVLNLKTNRINRSNKQMNQHNFGNKNFKKFIKGSNQNNLLKTLQNGISGDNKSYDAYTTMYRKKAYSHYSKKITKPFKLADQPEYYDQLNFCHHFKEFVNSIDYFNTIQQNPPNQLDTLQSKVTKQTFASALTMEPVSVPQRKQFLKQVIKTYDPSTIIKFGRQDSITSQKKQQQSTFPTHKTIQLYQVEGRRRNFSIPKDLNLSNQMHNQANLRRQNTHKYSSPNKSPGRNQKGSLNLSPKRKGNNQPYTVGLKRKTSQIAPIKKLLDEDSILNRLNQINQTKAKRQNLRVQKLKIHDLLKNRYGNQIFTVFFGFANVQNFEGMLTIFNQLFNLEVRNSHLLSFLTLDVNQDGLICEEDLYKITNAIEVDSIVHEDIRKITQWVNKTNTGRSTPDLPVDFVSCPTLRGLKRVDEGSFKAFADNNAPVSNFTGAAKSYLKKLYSVNYTQYEKDSETQNGKANLPHLLKNPKKKGNKKFSINFQMFQEIFKTGHCSFISDLIYYLTRIKTNSNIVDEDIKRNFKKYSQGNYWLNYDTQLFREKVYFNNERRSEVKKWHGDLRNFNKTFAIMKYE